MNKSALFSNCRKFRYYLYREWDENKPKIMFIGLNPSTANETDDDPTIRRVVRFAKDWGYGGVYMTNLFSFVTPDPKMLNICDNTEVNDFWLLTCKNECEKIIFAWGSFKEAYERAKKITQMFDGYALKINKDGSPRHPLYVPANTKIIKYKI